MITSLLPWQRGVLVGAGMGGAMWALNLHPARSGVWLLVMITANACLGVFAAKITRMRVIRVFFVTLLVFCAGAGLQFRYLAGLDGQEMSFVDALVLGLWIPFGGLPFFGTSPMGVVWASLALVNGWVLGRTTRPAA